jgi:glutamate---cysteine ligase / carboxylate-amine ligase
MGILTLGVEEEFVVVDPVTRAVVSDGRPVLRRLDEQGLAGDEDSGYDQELQLCMIESRTAVCHRLDEVRAQLERLRRNLARAATDTGHRIMAAGTSPAGDWRTQRITPKPRYEHIAHTQQQIAREQIVCGCHVHVGIDDNETAVQVLNRVRPWLPALLALSASSPFWMGRDSGYASYRTIVWGRWPSAGMPEHYRSVAEYRAVVQALIDTGTILDPGQIYWDTRLGNQLDTLEFRIADVCTTVDDAVLQAGLCRALVRTYLDELACGRPFAHTRPELLRAAKWRAARSGVEDGLIDIQAGETVPAVVMLDRLLHHLRPALEEAGDWDEVAALIQQVQRRGTSARRQRDAFEKTHRLEDVVDLLVGETASISSI